MKVERRESVTPGQQLEWERETSIMCPGKERLPRIYLCHAKIGDL